MVPLMKIDIISTGSQKGNAYMVSDGETSLLLDAGTTLNKIQIGCDFQLHDISACLISHQHSDHTKGMRGLAQLGVDIYASPDTLAACGVSGHRYHIISSMLHYQIGTFMVMPFDVHHDVRNYGYQLDSMATGERLIYMTDTYYTEYTFGQPDYLMIECNYSAEAIDESIAKGYIPESLKKRLLRSHMALNTFLDLLHDNDLTRCKQIYLLHLSDNNSNEDEFKTAVQRETGCEVYVA